MLNRAKLVDIVFSCKGLITSALNPKFEIHNSTLLLT